jgi:lysyl-tRNA synthetase class 2
VTRDAVGEEAYAAFKHWDLGDIVAPRQGVQDAHRRTVAARHSIRLLTKSLRPMPDKFHGMPTRR